MNLKEYRIKKRWGKIVALMNEIVVPIRPILLKEATLERELIFLSRHSLIPKDICDTYLCLKDHVEVANEIWLKDARTFIKRLKRYRNLTVG